MYPVRQGKEINGRGVTLGLQIAYIRVTGAGKAPERR